MGKYNKKQRVLLQVLSYHPTVTKYRIMYHIVAWRREGGGRVDVFYFSEGREE